MTIGTGREDPVELHDLGDVCACGDSRDQHVDGTGRCRLAALCTPSPCHRFRLFQRASER
jgi:hypothetical protein